MKSPSPRRHVAPHHRPSSADQMRGRCGVFHPCPARVVSGPGLIPELRDLRPGQTAQLSWHAREEGRLCAGHEPAAVFNPASGRVGMHGRANPGGHEPEYRDGRRPPQARQPQGFEPHGPCETNKARIVTVGIALENRQKSGPLTNKTNAEFRFAFKLVPEARLELARLAAEDFESPASTIPPLGPADADLAARAPQDKRGRVHRPTDCAPRRYRRRPDHRSRSPWRTSAGAVRWCRG